MKTRKEIQINAVLENYINEVLKDIDVFGASKEAVIYFKLDENDKQHFSDYEVLSSEEEMKEYELDEEYNPDDEQEDAEDYDLDDEQEYIEAKMEGRVVPGTTNIFYLNEGYMKTNLKTVLSVVTKLFHPIYPVPTRTFIVNVLSFGDTLTECAKKIGYSKQMVSQIFKNERPVPTNKREEIAKIYNFDVEEFEKETEEFIFDESDL